MPEHDPRAAERDLRMPSACGSGQPAWPSVVSVPHQPFAAPSAGARAVPPVPRSDDPPQGDLPGRPHQGDPQPGSQHGGPQPGSHQPGSRLQPGDDVLLTPAEVAGLFRVDPRTVTRWARSGKIGCVRTLGGHRRFRAREVLALLHGIPEQRGA